MLSAGSTASELFAVLQRGDAGIAAEELDEDGGAGEIQLLRYFKNGLVRDLQKQLYLADQC